MLCRRRVIDSSQTETETMPSSADTSTTDSKDGSIYDNRNKVFLRDHFRLPQYICDRLYVSDDQFITVETEDGVKMLHIYHLNKFMVRNENRSFYKYRRLFCDHKTGWSYCYTKDKIYRKYKKVLMTTD